MRRLLYFLLLLTSCTGDYFPESKFINSYKPKVVVYSTICPDSTIYVKLFWSKRYDDKSQFQTVDQAEVQINENDQVIYTGQSLGGEVKTSFYPKVGKIYKLIVRVEGEEEISATTTIPEKASVVYTTRGKLLDENSDRGYALMDFSKLEAPKNARAVWITGYYRMDDGERRFYREIYTNNPFVDQVNAAGDSSDAHLRESNKVFQPAFLRIPKSAFDFVIPLTYSEHVFWKRQELVYDPNGELDEWGNTKIIDVINIYIKSKIVVLITPSDEYDRYYQAAYKQFSFEGSVSSLTNYEAVSVYSNIKNGVGIFAGYNQAEFSVELNNPAKK